MHAFDADAIDEYEQLVSGNLKVQVVSELAKSARFF
jgi:hypothetical protein